MAILVTDPWLEDRLKTEREQSGADRYDEVWEGVYMMTPMPNIEHQQIATRLASILAEIMDRAGLGEVFAGINLSDRRERWEQNYRVPDVAVFLRDTKAENCGTHWRGPADFLVEIISPEDRTREKLPFYGRIGVEELLWIDRQPWALELYRQKEGQLEKAAHSSPGDGQILASAKVPLSFELLPGSPRPQSAVTHIDSGRIWRV